MHPSLVAAQTTEIASITNRMSRTIGSPLMLPKHHTCLLSPLHDADKNSLIASDHTTETYSNVKSSECRGAKESVRFVRNRPFTFWNRVRDSFVSEINFDG